jgi:Fe(3+) dicitrate transport protein
MKSAISSSYQHPNRINLVLLATFFWIQLGFAQSGTIRGVVSDKKSEKALGGVFVQVNKGKFEETASDGIFKFANLEAGTYTLSFSSIHYQTIYKTVILQENQDFQLNIQLQELEIDLGIMEVNADADSHLGLTNLQNVEGLAINAVRKNEVIQLKNLVANLATNNARQVYKGIAGLNIWESDGAGLQLSIGARGLDPNRTSNFNTRQNGYDISADALGYPESYYTPPTQALERIEIIRGAASLQYGPQFGGLLNFVFKKDADKPFEFVSENTVGSFGLLNTFNSIGGSKNGWKYYGFMQFKRGDGWRENAEFDQKTGYFSLSKNFKDKFSIGVEYTHMDYLAQQAGGLQDFEFNQNPRQSKRGRNWFHVDWNLAALNLDYKISETTKINSRSFALAAMREALGELGAINRPDPLRERDLIRGTYNNFGNETRLLHRYQWNSQYMTFLVGTRYYQGFTTSQQGDADDGSDANFTFLHPTDLERSDYEFPSQNASVFVENLFNINEKWTITPGIRFEYIHTASEGYYKERVFSGGQVIFEQTFQDAKKNGRHFLLTGIGVGHKISNDLEIYGNFSQNYRSINFSDLAVVNPNLIVDSLLQDEKGYNLDLGFRGKAWDNAIRFDASLFFLSYQNRIGVGEIIINDPSIGDKAVAFRTNIGNARIVGLEAYIEADILKICKAEKEDWDLSWFTNLSALHGRYISGRSDFIGNQVESIPPFSIKTGINARWKNLKLAYQFAYTATHFSDATNSEFVSDATRGLIPAYHIQDISLCYAIKRVHFSAGVNNLTNEYYFTRRATAYPGPGIIPSDGRNFYLGVGLKI